MTYLSDVKMKWPAGLIVKDLDPAELSKPAAEPQKPNPLAQVRQITTAIGNERPGLFQATAATPWRVQDLESDLPWED